MGEQEKGEDLDKLNESQLSNKGIEEEQDREKEKKFKSYGMSNLLMLVFKYKVHCT